MRIAWSDEAVADYHQNIDYLLTRWTETSAITFIEEVDAVLEIIKNQPDIYPLSDYRSVRRAVIRKQITLFYKVEDDVIYLVRFWNTYQDPDSITL